MGAKLLIVKRFHIVSSIGDPNDPKVWSNTPRSLVDAFRKHVPHLETHDVTFRPRWKRLYQVINILSGLGGKQAHRIGLWRFQQRRLAHTRLKGLGPGTYLHLGSSHLPLQDIGKDEAHFYFTDYTVELMLNDSPFGMQVPARYRKLALRQEQQVFQQLSGIFTAADYVHERIIATGQAPAAKVRAVGSGLGRVQTFEGAAKDYGSGHLLFVAKQNFRGKGGVLLLDALDYALQSSRELKLVVIGNVDDPQASDSITRMQTHKSIEFHNWDTPHFRNLVQSAALYVGPAHDEPYGIIYLEALLCETPILGLNRNAFPQFADHGRCGFIVNNATPRAVGTAIVDAMSDPQRLKTMGMLGRRYILDTFSWDKSVMAMIDFIEAAAIGSLKRL